MGEELRYILSLHHITLSFAKHDSPSDTSIAASPLAASNNSLVFSLILKKSH